MLLVLISMLLVVKQPVMREPALPATKTTSPSV